MTRGSVGCPRPRSRALRSARASRTMLVGVGRVQQPVDVGDDQTLRREPWDECVDRTLLERRVAALAERAEQRRPVAGLLATELNDIPAHGVDLLNDPEALEACGEHAGIAL